MWKSARITLNVLYSMSRQLNDPSPRTGVYTGDLAYGKCNGSVPDKHGDYTGTSNKPICALTLVRARDPKVWTKDPLVKEARKYVVENQSLKNGVINAFMENLKHLRANYHLTVGKQRF
jgi:hypothetical protein